MMTPVFADASSLILLEKAGLFSLMCNTYSLVITPRVLKEITTGSAPDAAGFALYVALKRMHVMALPENHPDKTWPGLDKLDPGERQTIGLYLTKKHETKNDRHEKQGFILIDDGPGARWCQNNGLPFINALLVPKILWIANLIDKNACDKAMARLCDVGWYSDWVRAFAFDCTKKELQPFLPERNHDTPPDHRF